MMVARQLTETIGPALKAVRATAFAAIDYLGAQLAGAIRRIDPPPPPSAGQHESTPETIPGWTTVTGTGTNGTASAIKHENGEWGPASGGALPGS